MSEATATLTRDEMRAKIFGGDKAKPQKRIISFFGADIELRQPTLGAILAAQKNEDREAAVIDTLVENAYIPDTQVRIFEDTDADSFKAMPFGEDFVRVSEAIEEMSNVNFRDKESLAKTTATAPVDNEAGLGTEAD